MAKTLRMNIPYPSEHQDPWYDAFVGTVEALDSACYASREDRQIVLMGGGRFSFNVDSSSQSGVAILSWTSPIYIASPLTGFTWTVIPGAVSLVDGQVLYVQLTRAPTSNLTVAAAVGNQVPSSDEAFLIGIRKGLGASAHFYFRNGKVLANGDSASVLETNGGGSSDGTGRVFKEACRVATTGNVTFNGAAPAIVDGVPVVIDNRILLYRNDNAEENGIYRVTDVGSGYTGTWVRASDFNTNDNVSAGCMVPVAEGDTHADKLFELATNNPITLDTTPILFVAIGANLTTNVPHSLDLSVTAGSSGSSDRASREDHVHVIQAGIAADITSVDTTTADPGNSDKAARANHKHPATYGTASNTICQGNDARLTNDRTANAFRTDGGGSATIMAATPTQYQVLVAGSGGTSCAWATVDHVNLASKGTNTHSAIDTFIGSKGQASGLAPLGADGKVPSVNIPTPNSFKVVKSTAGTISYGYVVYVNGWSDTYGCPTVEQARADSTLTMPAVGMAMAAITDTVPGDVLTRGVIGGFNTDEVGTLYSVSAEDSGCVRPGYPDSGEYPNGTIQWVGQVIREHLTDGQLALDFSVDTARAYQTPALPSNVGTAASTGFQPAFSRHDHVHAHGNLTGGALHASATQSANGFMTAADKLKLDQLPQESYLLEDFADTGTDYFPPGVYTPDINNANVNGNSGWWMGSSSYTGFGPLGTATEAAGATGNWLKSGSAAACPWTGNHNQISYLWYEGFFNRFATISFDWTFATTNAPTDSLAVFVDAITSPAVTIAANGSGTSKLNITPGYHRIWWAVSSGGTGTHSGAGTTITNVRVTPTLHGFGAGDFYESFTDPSATYSNRWTFNTSGGEYEDFGSMEYGLVKLSSGATAGNNTAVTWGYRFSRQRRVVFQARCLFAHTGPMDGSAFINSLFKIGLATADGASDYAMFVMDKGGDDSSYWGDASDSIKLCVGGGTERVTQNTSFAPREMGSSASVTYKYHVFTIVLGDSSVSFYVDGVSQGTVSNYRPRSGPEHLIQPYISVKNSGSLSRAVFVDYVACGSPTLWGY